MGDDNKNIWDIPEDDLAPSGLPKTAGSTVADQTGENFEHKKYDDPFGDDLKAESIKQPPVDQSAKEENKPKVEDSFVDKIKETLSAKKDEGDAGIISATTMPSPADKNEEQKEQLSSVSVSASDNGNLSDLESKLKTQLQDLDKEIKDLEQKKAKLSEVLSQIEEHNSKASAIFQQAQELLS